MSCRTLLMSSLTAATTLACSGGRGAVPVAPTQIATQLAFIVQPSSTAAGQAFAPAVQVEIQDASGARVANATSAVTITFGTNPSSGRLSGTATATHVEGVATFSDLSIDLTGVGYTLVATSGSLSAGVSAPFTIFTAQAATELAFIVQPSDAAPGEALTPALQVEIRDAKGARVTNATNSVTVTLGTNPSGGVLSGTATTNAVGGVATFPGLSVDPTGVGYTLVASAGSLTAGTSAPFTISAAFASVSAGGDHSCAVTTKGAVYCWGGNGYGQLGDGTTTSRAHPVRVGGGLTVRSVITGTYFTCALTIANAAYCWGFNGDGELGDGSTTNRTSPVAVSGGIAFASLGVNRGYSVCGLSLTGVAFCWGNDQYGQAGNGTNSIRSVPAPVAVGGGLVFTSLSTGNGSSCGVTASGTAYCWGLNSYGEYGDSTTNTKSSPTIAASGLGVVALSAGAYHTCALVTGGEAYCWGDNGDGQVGDGALDDHPLSPTLVIGGLRFATLSAGDVFTCGITTVGAAECWGQNFAGEVGDGTSGNNRVGPVSVAGGLSFGSISSGGAHVCGVSTSGEVYCWGGNDQGQVGIGTTSTPQTTPAHVVP